MYLSRYLSTASLCTENGGASVLMPIWPTKNERSPRKMQHPSRIFLKQACLHLKEHSTCLIRVWKSTLPLLLEQAENRLEIILQQFGDGTTGCDTLRHTDLHFQEHVACPSNLITGSIIEGQGARLATDPLLQANAVTRHQYEEPLLLSLLSSVTLI